MNITDKTVLITGAYRGIGRVLVQEALKRGPKQIYAAARGARTITDERVTPLALDVTRASQIAQAADAVVDLGVLIKNAGTAICGDFSDFHLIEQHLAANLFGVLTVDRPTLASQGGTVEGAILGPVDTDMRPNLGIPKASPESAAQGLFDALTRGEEDIFPAPAFQMIAEGWRNGVAKVLEYQFKVFGPESAAQAA